MKEFIEKLIGSLEELPTKGIGRYKGGSFGNWEGTDYFIKQSDAIKIVNKIAEEYNNGFCEWEVYGNRNHAVTGHGQVKYTYEVEDWLVCPYCGKKIKVVE